MNLIGSAASYAAYAHRDDVRKYNGEPYIMHPMRVAGYLSMYGYDNNLIAAGWLHDVVEDHPEYSIKDLRKHFNDDVADLCSQVTNLSIQPHYLNLPRSQRVKMNREHVCRGSIRGQILKAFDRLDNIRSLLGAKDDFKRLYLAETKLLVDDLVIPPFIRELFLQAYKVIQ